VIAVPTLAFAALLALLLVFAVVLLYRLVEQDNPLQWVDLVATHGVLNAYKIGYWIGSGIGAWVVVKQTLTNHLDPSVFAAWLAFIGGVTAFTSMAGRDRPTPGVDTRPPPEAQ